MIHDFPVNLAVYTVEFLGVALVNGIKQCRERIAQVETRSATVAGVKNALEFLNER